MGREDCPHADMIDAIIDRQDILETDQIKDRAARERFSDRIDSHMKYEDEFKKEMGERFKAGDERMGNIEQQIGSLNRLVDAFDGFQKTLRITGYFAGAVVAIVLWIFTEKNADIKVSQDTLIKHSIALEKLVSSHQELEKDFRREIEMVRKN